MIDYIYRFDIAAFVVGVAILISLIRNKVVHTRVVNTFQLFFILIILASLFDIISIFALKYPEIFPRWATYLFNMCYHLVFLSIPQTFYYAIYYSTEENRSPSIYQRLFFTIPYIIVILILITSPIFNGYFYFDENFIYHRGKLIITGYISSAFYICASMVRTIKLRKRLATFHIFVVHFYIVLIAATLIIQYFLPQYMLMNFAIAVSAMIAYLIMENPSDYMDKEMEMFNRAGFIELVGKYFSKKKTFTILAVKLVDYKAIINAIGDENKEKLLRQISQDLLQVSPRHHNFRLSQSRFAIILDDNPLRQKLQLQAIIDHILKPFKCGEMELFISVKAFLVSCPDEAENLDDLLELMEHSYSKTLSVNDRTVPRADIALIQQRYENQRIYTLVNDAYENNRLELVFQPIYNVKEKEITSAEARLRVKIGNNSYISSEDFMDITEKSGLCIKVGEVLLEKVCKFISTYKPYDYDIRVVVINLSVLECMQENLAEKLLRTIDLYGIPHKFIRFRVSENATYLAKDILLQNIKKLKEKNICFSMDEIGSGLSNVVSLESFQFDSIRIGKEFIYTAMREEKAYAILKELVIALQEMNYKVIASGIESKEQFEILEYFGCDYLQGKYFSVPLNTERFINMLKN